MASSTGITEHYVARQEGGRVYYYKTGQGEPLVFIGGGSGRGFRLITDGFAQHSSAERGPLGEGAGRRSERVSNPQGRGTIGSIPVGWWWGYEAT